MQMVFLKAATTMHTGHVSQRDRRKRYIPIWAGLKRLSNSKLN